MVTVEMAVELGAPASEVWDVVGRFGELDRWHPWVPNCSLSADGRTRTIALGGTSAIEQLEEPVGEACTHTYRVLQSPMPITDYRATWSVRDRPGGCALEIRATFAPRGVPEEQAEQMIRAFFDAGFGVLVGRFGRG